MGMPTSQIIYFGVIGFGAVIFAIGGFIDMLTNYKSWNDSILHVSRHGGRTGLDFSNPKARPWGIAGIVLAVGGLVLLFFGPIF